MKTTAILTLFGSLQLALGFQPSMRTAYGQSATALSMATPADNVSDRRRVLQSVFGATAAAATVLLSEKTAPAQALDMDAFMNSELASDSAKCDPKDPKCIPKLSQDEALCKYGQIGEARAEACKRVKASGGKVDKADKGKSLGGAYAM